MVSLLIATKISSKTIQDLDLKEDSSLPRIFEDIKNIQRFNRTADDALQVLNESEQDLAYMAIPYALSIHESLLFEATTILKNSGKHPITKKETEDLKKLSLEEAHEYIADTCAISFNKDNLQLFHLIRQIRNRVIHDAGTPGSNLMPYYNSLSQNTRKEWEKLSNRSLKDVVSKDYLALSNAELISALAICQRLANELNAMLEQSVSRDFWLRIAVKDYADNAWNNSDNDEQRAKHLLGYVKQFYGKLKFSAEELNHEWNKL